MIGPSSCNFILKGSCPEDIERVQDILNSYIKYGITPGKAMSFESSDALSDPANTWIIDLSNDGMLKMKHLSLLPDRECRILYEKEDRACLIEQMVLMVSGMREKDLDYELDMLPILEKTCRFICMDDLNSDLISKVVTTVRKFNNTVREKGITDYDFLMQLCDCDMLFAADIYDAIEGIEDSDSITYDDQIIQYRTSTAYKGTDPKYGIVSIFCPV